MIIQVYIILKRYQLILLFHKKVDIITVVLTEINKEITNFISTIRQSETKNNEMIRSLESPLSFLIDILLNLAHTKKIGLFKDFINREVIFILTQVYLTKNFNFIVVLQITSIDYPPILNASVTLCELCSNLLNSNVISDVLEFTLIFGHSIFKRLNQIFVRMNNNTLDETNEIYNLRVILSHLEKFILDKDNLLRMIGKNDFNFLKRPLFGEIMTLLFEVIFIFSNFFQFFLDFFYFF